MLKTVAQMPRIGGNSVLSHCKLVRAREVDARIPFEIVPPMCSTHQ
jgi:hypothetical protein